MLNRRARAAAWCSRNRAALSWADPVRVPLPLLVKAILSRAREREGHVTKTKLVKYLYLLDVATYRKTGQTLTGFPWRFHLYGPWADEFETLYRELARQGQIQVTPSQRPDIDAEFVTAEERLDLADLVDDVGLGLEFRHIVDQWADRRLGEMLDYVYFYTEPMETARRGEALDFSVVQRERVELRLPDRVRVDKRLVQRLKEGVERRKAEFPPEAEESFTPPRYDETYERARKAMEEEEDAY